MELTKLGGLLVSYKYSFFVSLFFPVSRKLRREEAGREIIRYIKMAVISFVNKKPCGFKDGSWKVSAKRLTAFLVKNYCVIL